MLVVRRGRPRSAVVVQSEMPKMPEMTAVFRTMLPSGSSRPGGGAAARWRPAIEVYETDEALVVNAEIAGIDEARLEVMVDGEVLAIRGERQASCPEDERRSYHEARIPYGAFGADIHIPFPVDDEATVAEYQNGFLRIVLPRAAARTIVARRTGGQAERREGAQ